MGWMLLLLLFFSGAGTFFNIVLLNEASTPWPWIATIISMVIFCIVVVIMRLKESLDALTIVLTIGFFGVVQMIIIGTIKIPRYWKDDEWVLRIVGSFFSQPLVFLIGYGISCLVEKNVKSNMENAVYRIKKMLNSQLKALNEINKSIQDKNRAYLTSEKMIDLLELINGSQLKDTCISVRFHMDSETLVMITKLSKEYSLGIDVDGKTLLSIKRQVQGIINEKNKLLNRLEMSECSKDDYLWLKSEMKSMGL